MRTVRAHPLPSIHQRNLWRLCNPTGHPLKKDNGWQMTGLASEQLRIIKKGKKPWL
jgi:hypothetical protein